MAKGSLFEKPKAVFQKSQLIFFRLPGSGCIDVVVERPGIRRYNRRGGRPPLDVDFKAVCDAVLGAWNGSEETITGIAGRFGVSRGWIWKWVYPELGNVGQVSEPSGWTLPVR